MAGPATVDRRLDWDGCCNVRDLGGLPAADGRVVRRGALVRADAVDRLSAAGWAALWAPRAIAAIARARPGGVLIHCGIGRDRTGLITMLALALVGVAPEDIAADYALSSAGVRTLLARLGEPDHVPGVDAYLEREGTSTDEVIVSLLASLDIPAWMGAGGLEDADVVALCERLLVPVGEAR